MKDKQAQWPCNQWWLSEVNGPGRYLLHHHCKALRQLRIRNQHPNSLEMYEFIVLQVSSSDIQSVQDSHGSVRNMTRLV